MKHGGNNKIHVKKEWYSKVEKYSMVGLTIRQIATLLNVSKRTIERRIVEDEQLADALERGRAMATYNLLLRVYERAMAGDNFCLSLLLKRRFEIFGLHEHEPVRKENVDNSWEVTIVRS